MRIRAIVLIAIFALQGNGWSYPPSVYERLTECDQIALFELKDNDSKEVDDISRTGVILSFVRNLKGEMDAKHPEVSRKQVESSEKPWFLIGVKLSGENDEGLFVAIPVDENDLNDLIAYLLANQSSAASD